MKVVVLVVLYKHAKFGSVLPSGSAVAKEKLDLSNHNVSGTTTS